MSVVRVWKKGNLQISTMSFHNPQETVDIFGKMLLINREFKRDKRKNLFGENRRDFTVRLWGLNFRAVDVFIR